MANSDFKFKNSETDGVYNVYDVNTNFRIATFDVEGVGTFNFVSSDSITLRQMHKLIAIAQVLMHDFKAEKEIEKT